ncbi:MAG: efflux RND transporter permease subunit [Planctomycetota bacterium]|nr:efflux RND transporter permease subunit [Planctomycetota bacterium]
MSDLFIRRPIMTTLVMLSILLFGLIGYRLLPVNDLPNVDSPTIEVSASLPGASAETMASSVATVLEKEFSTIAGIDAMSSSSSQGSTRITVDFTLSRDIDAAAQDIQAAIARSLRRLPPEMTTPPSYRKSNPADQPILWLALTSKAQPMSVLDDLGQTMMAQRISMIDGVAQVQVYGSQKKAVRIELDPLAMFSRDVGIDEVADAIGDQNVNIPLGTLSGPHRAFTLQANGQIAQADQYLPLIVMYRQGKTAGGAEGRVGERPIRLGEIANVVDSVENDKVAAWFTSPEGGRQRSIVLAVQRQPGTNTVEVAKAVKAMLPDFREKLPASVSLEVLRDSSLSIVESATDVQFTLLLTLVLVVMVIFLFLRSVRATVIPSLALPMSIIGTFAVMWLMDYSLDNLSLMALTLSVGFVVDDAVVMLENIYRHMEMGKARMQAAFEGSREIGFTIVSMTISLAAVFIPVLFMGGKLGRLFREFSVTIGVAVLVSGVVSLSLTPMLASRFLADEHKRKHGAFYRVSEWCFDAMLRFYGWTLRGVLRHRRITMLFSLSIMALTAYLYLAIPKGFIPSEDRDMIQIRTDGAQDISFDSMVRHHMVLADIVGSDPNVEKFMTSVGSGGPSSTPNNGRLMVVLKPRKERTMTAEQVIESLRPRLAAVPGVRVFPSIPPTIQLGGRQGQSLYQITVQGVDTAELFAYASELERKMREDETFRPLLQDISSDLQVQNAQVDVWIDRDQAKIRGVTPRQIMDALYSAYGTRQISTIYTPNNEYQVILELLPEQQTDPSKLSALYVRSSRGPLVPLKAVTRQSESVGPLTVNHTGQLPSVTISFNLKPGVSLGQAVDAVKAAAQARPGITTTSQGTAKAFDESLASMPILLLLAVVVIYIVLGILYESYWHPITILSALPFAGVGAFLTLMLFGSELSVYAFVGIIMLVGLVKKRTEGKTPQQAIYEACLVRFRPIMMTTMAALMAGLPIAMGYGAGAEARRPLGLAVVGGLLFSQSLTLYVTPVFYVYMEKLRMMLTRKGPVPAQA